MLSELMQNNVKQSLFDKTNAWKMNEFFFLMPLSYKSWILITVFLRNTLLHTFN